MSITNVLVCGYYGFGNAGDEAILSVLIGDLRRKLDHPAITVIGGSIEAIAADHHVDAISWQDLPSIRKAAEDADLMVLGGGGLFQDQQPFDPHAILTAEHGGMSYWAGFALLSHMVEKPLAIYGAGVGPLSSADGRRLTALAFQAASAATVRDEESAQLLGELGINAPQVTTDPVFAMTVEASVGRAILDSEHIHRVPPLVAVVVRPWADNPFVSSLAAGLDGLITRHRARVVFIPFQTSPHRSENDAAIALDVLKEMRQHASASIVRGSYTPEDKLAILGSAHLVVGMRLHAVVMAAVAAVPVVALAYDPKVTSVMRALGAGDLVMGLDDLTSLNAMAERAMSDSSLSVTVAGRAKELAEVAAANGDVLTEALQRGPLPVDLMAKETSSVALRQLELSLRLEEQKAAAARLAAAEAERDRLQRDWDHLVGSRSLRLVNSWWALRNRLRRPRAEGPPAPIDRRAELERELAQVLAEHREAAGIVVYPPTIGWASHLFQRPQQMARAFARMGYLVFFGVEAWEPGQIDGFRYAEDRLCLMGLPDEHLVVLGKIPDPLMVSYVYNFEYRRHLTNPTTIFEHIDHLDVFAQTYPLEQLGDWYATAVSEADVAVASARDLQTEMAAQRPDAILCPNGVTFEHFAGYRPGLPSPELLPALAGNAPIVGYYGALAEWIDYDLVDHAAARLPQFNFVFIGPNYDGSMDRQPVFKRPNVWWLGPKEYADLPAYLHHFSVATIPFVVNDVTHAVSPLKLFEYMAGGKPIVTTAMRESQRYEVVLIAHDRDEWVRQLVEAEARSHDEIFVAALRRTARANTWDQRVGTLIDAAARARLQ